MPHPTRPNPSQPIPFNQRYDLTIFCSQDASSEVSGTWPGASLVSADVPVFSLGLSEKQMLFLIHFTVPFTKGHEQSLSAMPFLYFQCTFSF